MSVKVKITASSKASLKRDFEAFARAVGLSVEDSVAAVAVEVANEAKRKAPVDHGRLRASIRPEKKSKYTWIVGTNVGYGLYVEYGTGPHVIRVKNKKVLSDGKQFFGKEVMHPGTRAQPFLRPAFSSVKRRMMAKLKQNLR